MWNPLAALPPPNAFSITSHAGGASAPLAQRRFNPASLNPTPASAPTQMPGQMPWDRPDFGDPKAWMQSFVSEHWGNQQSPTRGALAGYAPAPGWLGDTQYTPSQWDGFAQQMPGLSRYLSRRDELPEGRGITKAFHRAMDRGGFG